MTERFDLTDQPGAPLLRLFYTSSAIARLGARVGLEAITRRHPGAGHIPEKAAQVLAAAWSDPARDWPAPRNPRPGDSIDTASRMFVLPDPFGP